MDEHFFLFHFFSILTTSDGQKAKIYRDARAYFSISGGVFPFYFTFFFLHLDWASDDARGAYSHLILVLFPQFDSSQIPSILPVFRQVSLCSFSYYIIITDNKGRMSLGSGDTLLCYQYVERVVVSFSVFPPHQPVSFIFLSLSKGNDS